jgi:hypothetical protein
MHTYNVWKQPAVLAALADTTVTPENNLHEFKALTLLEKKHGQT